MQDAMEGRVYEDGIGIFDCHLVEDQILVRRERGIEELGLDMTVMNYVHSVTYNTKLS